MDAKTELLLTILGRTDATFWPCRSHVPRVRAVVYERRRDFMARGLAWASGATTAAERMRASRQLRRLGRRLTITGGRAGRAMAVKLADKTYDDLRRLCGVATMADSLPLLDELLRRADGPDTGTCLGRRWTSEQELTGVKWGGDTAAYAHLSTAALPLLARGFVESNASCQGHVWYALTPAGRDLAQARVADGLARPYTPIAPTPADAEAVGAYDAASADELAALAKAAPESKQELGLVPLPVSMPTESAAPVDSPAGRRAHDGKGELHD
ncbi:MAG: hypothetical protein ACE15C_08490 [Phycisphaerae bacterium]